MALPQLRLHSRLLHSKNLMLELIAALGLALAVEGILFAAFPDGMRRAMYEAAHSPSDRMRVVGIVSALMGVGIIWLVRWLG